MTPALSQAGEGPSSHSPHHVSDLRILKSQMVGPSQTRASHRWRCRALFLPTDNDDAEGEDDKGCRLHSKLFSEWAGPGPELCGTGLNDYISKLATVRQRLIIIAVLTL